MSPSPWSHADSAPLQSVGALVPIIETPQGQALAHEAHGTGFFVTADGMFVTAGHVFDFPGGAQPPVVMSIFSALGMTMMPVNGVARHPTLDVAVGFVEATRDQASLIRPMTIALTTLPVGAEVAVLGYPRTITEHKLDNDGTILSRLSLTPDYYEGHIQEHHPNGIGLVRGGPAYLTDIVAPGDLRDLGGASGGPLVNSETLQVHGFLSSSSESYAICTDIAALLDWEFFALPDERMVSLRAILGFTGAVPPAVI